MLDLFCGAGGAGMGYSRAGFDVVGVDINPQPHYPFEFHQADALEYLADHWREFDVIHASPPCQAYSMASTQWRKSGKQYPDLIKPTRTALQKTGKSYVIENVVGAPLINPTILNGSFFGMRVRRTRLFETSFPIPFTLMPKEENPRVKQLKTKIRTGMQDGKPVPKNKVYQFRDGIFKGLIRVGFNASAAFGPHGVSTHDDQGFRSDAFAHFSLTFPPQTIIHREAWQALVSIHSSVPGYRNCHRVGLHQNASHHGRRRQAQDLKRDKM